MEEFITIAVYSSSMEAHMAKSKLESEGIQVVLLDENIHQIVPMASSAYGGVRLQVLLQDAHRAVDLLDGVE